MENNATESNLTAHKITQLGVNIYVCVYVYAAQVYNIENYADFDTYINIYVYSNIYSNRCRFKMHIQPNIDLHGICRYTE